MLNEIVGSPIVNRVIGVALPRSKSPFSRVLTIYRFLSVLLTSAMYLLSPSAMLMVYRVIVVAALVISAIVVNAILNSHADDSRYLSYTLIIDTVGIALLLIPTGGMDSPYLWYALNPVLVAACYLKPFFYWLLLGFYSLASTTISAVLYRSDYPGFQEVIERWGIIFLIFILSMLAMQLLAQLIRKKIQDAAALKLQKEELDSVNLELKRLNEKLEESVSDLMSLYQSIDDLATETDQSVVVASLTQYASTLSKSNFSFFLMKEPGMKENKAVFSGNSAAQDQIERMTDDLIDGIACYEESVVVTVNECDFLVQAVKSTTKQYGLLGIGVSTDISGKATLIDCTRLSFIVNLFCIVLDRVGANEVENRLMIAQERNRIADEIHDSICQRLFSISCAAHSLANGLDSMNRHELLDQLALIEDCSKAANQEIRLCIYGLSSKKRKLNTLFEELEKYLWSYAKLNSIILEIDFTGDDSLLSIGLQKSLHRIVREACGNAARHGKCKNIGVQIAIRGKFVFLKITDDGNGFTVNEDRAGSSSVGIKNMTSMVERYGGTIDLMSHLHKGTTITVKIPLYQEDERDTKEVIL